MKWVVGFSFFLFYIFRSIWDICVCFLSGIKQQSKPCEGDVSREQWCLAHGQWGKSSHFLSGPTWEMAKAVLSPVVPVQMTAGGDPWGVSAGLLFLAAALMTKPAHGSGGSASLQLPRSSCSPGHTPDVHTVLPPAPVEMQTLCGAVSGSGSTALGQGQAVLCSELSHPAHLGLLELCAQGQPGEHCWAGPAQHRAQRAGVLLSHPLSLSPPSSSCSG